MRATREQIRSDFLGALARLMNSSPNSQELKTAASEGRLRINISTVAKEAGRSRTLIACTGLGYDDIRSAILASMGSIEDVAAPAKMGDEALEGAKAKDALIVLLLSENAALMIRALSDDRRRVKPESLGNIIDFKKRL